MFEYYKKFITDSLNKLLHTNTTTTFGDYFHVVLGLFLILISIALFVSIISGLVLLPKKAYNYIVGRTSKQVIEYLNTEESDTFDESILKSLEKKELTMKILYWTILILIYVPIILPLIFILGDLLLPVVSIITSNGMVIVFCAIILITIVMLLIYGVCRQYEVYRQTH